MKNNKLKVTIEDGSEVTVNVLDIIDSLEFNKTFMIYTVNDNDENIFVIQKIYQEIVLDGLKES